MIYKYIRFSTMKQEELSQDKIITEYLEHKGMKADATFKDEGVSGGKSYTQRNLYELCLSLQRHDTVVVSEVSRLTRSGIGELCEIIEKFFKPNGLRLIICNVGIDIDCSNIDPMTEMQLYIFAAVAKMEKELIRARTQAAIDCAKADIEEKGFHVTRKGRVITTLGGGKPTAQCHEAAGEKSAKLAEANKGNTAFEAYIEIYEANHGSMEDLTENKMEAWQRLADELNRLGYTTARGLEYNVIRAMSMYKNMKQRKRNKIKREEKCSSQSA